MKSGFEKISEPNSRVRRTLWLSILDGGVVTVYLNWTSGAVLTGYLLALGAGPILLATAASIPQLMQVANPALAWLASRQKSRRRHLIRMATISRCLWLIAVFIPFLPVTPGWWPILLVSVIGLSSLFQVAGGLAWIPMIADVVPDQLRGRYFGLRNGVCGIVGMLAGLAAGRYLDHMPSPAGFQMVILIAVIFGLFSIFLYPHHYERTGKKLFLSLREGVLFPLRDKNFRRFILFSAYWNATVMLASPFVIPYFFRHLNMTFTQVAVWAGIASVCGLFIGPLWGKVADRTGHKTVLMITTFLAGSVHPLCWMIAAPGFLWFVWLSGLMDALSWGGINTAMFNLTLISAPHRHRTAYLAVLGMTSGLSGCVAGLISGPLLHLLLEHHWNFGGFTWTGYHSLFLIAAILRMQAWRFLKPLHEEGAKPAGEFIRDSVARLQAMMRGRGCGVVE